MASMGFALGNTFSGPAVTVSLGIDPGLNRTGYAVIVRTSRGMKLRRRRRSAFDERALAGRAQ